MYTLLAGKRQALRRKRAPGWIDASLVCLTLIKRLGGKTIKGVVVNQGKLALVREIDGFLWNHDGRSQSGSVNWFQRAKEYRQAQGQLNGDQKSCALTALGTSRRALCPYELR